MALILICIVISGIVLLFGLLFLLAVGPQTGIFVIMAVGVLILAGSISRLLKLRNKRRNTSASNGPETTIVTLPDISADTHHGRYCPYCGAEFDNNDDEVCPNCGGRTKAGRPQL